MVAIESKLRDFQRALALLSMKVALVFACSNASASTFEREITPVLTKAGCNRGACHGAAAGRGGFRLSLYGSDAEADYQEIVLELGGRRLNRVEPDQSLLLLKATESIDHGGGQRLDAVGEGVERIRGWIENGANWNNSLNREATVNLSQLKLHPAKATVAQLGDSLKLQAVGLFSDGTREDVTRWTVFEAEDPTAVTIDPISGEVMVHRTGRHVVIARYIDQVKPLEILLPYQTDGTNDGRGKPIESLGEEKTVQGRSGRVASIVDSFIDERLLLLGLMPSGQCDDATFLRRCSLDLIGRLPTQGEAAEYYQQDPAGRRDWWIETLLASESFNRFWTLQLARLFRLRELPNSEKALSVYHRWLSEQVRQNIGYDKIARSLLTSRGEADIVGPANFLRTAEGPRERAELVSEVFMASRLRCANCHDHPLDRWKQDDYHGLSAILATIRVGSNVADLPSGTITHPKTGENAEPQIPGVGKFSVGKLGAGKPPEQSMTEAYVDWLVAPENPYFAKSIVNRLWKAMMGRGLVEPVDDFRETNPPSHPELLDQLATHFIRSKYNIRSALGEIARSDAYQRSSAVLPENQQDRMFYSRYYERSLQPEVFADAITDVLDVPMRYGNAALGTRAVDLLSPSEESRALDVLGRCVRTSSCEDSADAVAGGLSGKLFLFNGDLINDRLENERNRLAELIQDGKTPTQVITSFYEVALQRVPSQRELGFWLAEVEAADSGDRESLLRDFVWSLLGCHEFATNH